MRGLASILLVLAAAAAVIALAGIYGAQKERGAQTSSNALELERAYYEKLDFKHAAMQALSEGAESKISREDRAKAAAEKLAGLSDYLEKHGGAKLWCGIVPDSELGGLPEKISESKRPLAPGLSWSAGQKAVFYELYPERKVWESYKCLSFIDVDPVSGKAVVSKGGIALTQDPEIIAEQFGGKFVIGVSSYDEVTGIGSVAVIPEGTEAGFN